MAIEDFNQYIRISRNALHGSLQANGVPPATYSLTPKYRMAYLMRIFQQVTFGRKQREDQVRVIKAGSTTKIFKKKKNLDIRY